jgi:hypothetical protein
MEKILQVNGIHKQAEVVIFISNKADFKPKLVRRDKLHIKLIKEK